MVVVGLFFEKMASCHMRRKTPPKKEYIYIYMISFNFQWKRIPSPKVMHRLHKFLLGVEAENDMLIYQVSLLSHCSAFLQRFS